MAEVLATYGFLPWARQGIAGRIEEQDTLGNGNGTADIRARLNAELELTYIQLDSQARSNIIDKELSVIGPGDITGISQKAIVRTEPKKGVMNFEANGLPYIEFYEEDFLWRYTPASAVNQGTGNTRLRPWLALVVLKEDEHAFKKVTDGIPYINVYAESFNKAFHDEKDHWAFAHVHMNNKLEHTGGNELLNEIRSELSADPDSGVCRLLCPRKLSKTTAYHAYLIPAFETGRLSGLGLDISGVKAQTPSWKKGAAPATDKRPYDFPVYFSWNFHTASFGDFESLAAGLKPIILQSDSGKMPMDIQQPGFGLDTPSGGTSIIGMEAALKSPGYEPDPWPTNGGTNTADKNTVEKLKNLLNLSADLVDKNRVIADSNPFFNTDLGDDPFLVPPIYGVWHALVNKLGDGKNPGWVEELNLDFRNRAAAGLGTQVVQKHQEDLMHRAWQQVDRINEANKKIEAARMTKLVTRALFKKHMMGASDNKSLVMTNAVHHLIRNTAGTITIAEEFAKSRVPEAIKSAGFRKITRPNTTLARTGSQIVSQKRSRVINNSQVIGNFNLNQDEANFLSAAVLKRAPAAALGTVMMTQVIDTAISAYSGEPVNMAKDIMVELLDEKIMREGNSWNKAGLIQAILNLNFSPDATKQKTLDLANAITAGSYPLQKKTGDVLIVEIENAIFKEFFGEGIHAKNYRQVILKDQTPFSETELRPITTRQDAMAYKQAFISLNDEIQAMPKAAIAPALPTVISLAVNLFARLDPEVTLTRKMLSGIKIWRGNQYLTLTELKPVMASPEFDEASYTYLLEISKQFILPNIDKLPPDSITLMESNQTFIESFMAGLNHEMSRELLWREFPTDQRGSCFRQFWNIDDDILAESDDPDTEKELKLDITKMHTWKGKLGSHSPRTKSANLVLVIRGQLFKKYPNTMVYAQKAVYSSPDASKSRKLKEGISEADTRFPMFEATILPDISLFGFELLEEEARGDRIEQPGGSATGKNPGWFFILKERPGQIRFGLDDYTTEQGDSTVMPSGNADGWDDLSWEHLVPDKPTLDTYHLSFSKNITINHPTGQPRFGGNSAELAAILYQSPVLFARHAAEMLPEK